MVSGAGASSVASESSLSVARPVLQEYHVVDRVGSISLHEWVVKLRLASQNEVQVWPCDGPGCSTMMRHKSEWQMYYKKYYCKRCYAVDIFLPHLGDA